MDDELVSDDLWQTLQPLLPPERRTPRSRGRPRIPARAVLCGIVYVLKTGIPWKRLTKELGYGSGATCWRRLKEWQRAGVFSLLLRKLLDSLVTRGLIDWSRACVDSASVPAKKGGELVGPNPTDRGKPGTKRHLFTDTTGLPLAVLVTGANVHDCKVFEELLDAVPPVKGRRGRPRKRPEKLHADKGHDFPFCRRALHRRGIKVRIARRGKDSSSRLGRRRWVIERTLAWLSSYRRLTVRYERRAEIHEAFLQLACSLVCLGRLRRSASGDQR